MRTQLSLLAVLMMIGSMQPAIGQVNMQYSGRYGGQYSGQYGGQFSGQYSGQYYGRGSSDQTASPNALDRKLDIFGYPVNSGACGQLYYPSPGTDYVLHDRQGRRCY
ncbi:hypothetical protein KIP88_20910 [Bradyrhizobium sp. SRL28]|uniref:hypothetical protein n=1 Tax=Bradyrhizobium sp. SRL28 TaxID=2836178 RepID=UPI001BDF2352|nr:hypothetical protein [Bradyrhizobium sp. SRL28]MBT1512954.1 hypothetical protein [Bradyrhizobium sp. SRL28]